jgi:Glycosyl transferases group 1
VFGRQLYELIGSSKIVLNGAIDMAAADRGNMRCFEAMECGALLLSDEGNYPEGMDGRQTISTYESGIECVARIEDSLNNWVETKRKPTEGETK